MKKIKHLGRLFDKLKFLDIIKGKNQLYVTNWRKLI